MYLVHTCLCRFIAVPYYSMVHTDSYSVHTGMNSVHTIQMSTPSHGPTGTRTRTVTPSQAETRARSGLGRRRGCSPSEVWGRLRKKALLQCLGRVMNLNFKNQKSFFLPTVSELGSSTADEQTASADVLRNSLGFRCLLEHFLLAFRWIRCKWPRKRGLGAPWRRCYLNDTGQILGTWGLKYNW